MKYTNLVWAIKACRSTQYRVAAASDMGESAFSRALNGIAEFTPEQRQKIAGALGYPECWLFQEVRPPKPVRRELATDQVSAHV